MSKERSYKCDVQNKYIPKENAVPVNVLRVGTPQQVQENDLTLRESGNDIHVHEGVLYENLIQEANDFNTLEIVTVDGEVVGYRNKRYATTSEPRTPTPEEAAFLQTLV